MYPQKKSPELYIYGYNITTYRKQHKYRSFTQLKLYSNKTTSNITIPYINPKKELPWAPLFPA
jgi:hypothetical protein